MCVCQGWKVARLKWSGETEKKGGEKKNLRRTLRHSAVIMGLSTAFTIQDRSSVVLFAMWVQYTLGSLRYARCCERET